MKFLPLVWANLLRKKARTILTIGSIAVALFLYGLLAAIETAFSQGVDIAGADRLIVRNKISLIMPLPQSYADRIADMPGVAALTFASWFGGIYQDERNFFPTIAVDIDTHFDMYPEILAPEDEREALAHDREGCFVGRKLAERFGWKLGDRIPLKGTIWPGTWDFNVRAIYDGARPQDDTSTFFFRHDYLEERRTFGKGIVGWYVVRVEDPERAAQVVGAIDERFANSPYETATETEKSFLAGFAKQVGNVKLILLSVGGVVFVTLLLVTGNTMAIAVRERLGEIAVLKTIGFGGGAILALVIVEALFSALAGGVLGVAGAKLFTLGGDPTHGMLPLFYLAPGRMAAGLALAAACGVAAGLVPAVLAMRLEIVDALKRA